MMRIFSKMLCAALAMTALSGAALAQTTANPDVAYVKSMIEAHEQAMSASKAVLATSTNPDVRMFAGDVMRSHAAELDRMKTWMANGAVSSFGKIPAYVEKATSVGVVEEKIEKKAEAVKAEVMKPATETSNKVEKVVTTTKETTVEKVSSTLNSSFGKVEATAEKAVNDAKDEMDMPLLDDMDAKAPVDELLKK